MSTTTKLVASLAIACLGGVLTVNTAQGRLSQEEKQQARKVLERPKTATPLSQTELLVTLRESHIKLYGKAPSKRRLAMAWAQVALENAQGEVMWNHNVGNVGPRGNDVWYKHSNLTTYRSFDNFIDGAMTYWGTVERCGTTLKLSDLGYATMVAENLKRCGYFGADIELYVKGMNRLYVYALTKVIPNEERTCKEKEQARKDWDRYQSLVAFTPRCGCSSNELRISHR